MTKRGRPRTHHDSLHKYWRQASARYVGRNRKVWNYARRFGISIAEARRRLKIRKPWRKKK